MTDPTSGGVGPSEDAPPPPSPLPRAPHASAIGLVDLRTWLARWRRRLLVAFVAMIAAGCLPTLVISVTHQDGVRNARPLQSVTTAGEMMRELTCQNGGWPSAREAVPPGKAASAAQWAASEAANATPTRKPPEAAAAACEQSSGAAVLPQTKAVKLEPIRWVLGFDSLLVVPGYTGLFLLTFGFLFLRANPIAPGDEERVTVDRRELVLQLLCLVPAAAAAFDLAENGVTMMGIEDAVSRLLADSTVNDMHRATSLKWAFFGLSCGVAAGIAAFMEFVATRTKARHRHDPWLLAAAAFGLVASATLLWWSSNALRDGGTAKPAEWLLAAGLGASLLQMTCNARRIWQSDSESVTPTQQPQAPIAAAPG